MSEVAEAKPSEIQLQPGSRLLLEHASQTHDVVLPTGVDASEMLRPAFWAHVAVKMRPWDEIRARPEDGAWIAKCVVLASDRTWVKVALTQFNALSEGVKVSGQPLPPAVKESVDEQEDNVQKFLAGHRYMHRGQKYGHCIVRNVDGECLKEHLSTKQEALDWLNAHAREMVGAEPKAAG